MAVALAFFAVGVAAQDVVRVGSKADNEGAFLGQVVLQVLKHEGIPVVDHTQLGPTSIVRRALLGGDLDVYPEYTGNAAFFFHRESDPAFRDAAKAYALAASLDRVNHVTWLKPAPADNHWAIGVRRDVAEANGLRSLVDFARWVGGEGIARKRAPATEGPVAEGGSGPGRRGFGGSDGVDSGLRAPPDGGADSGLRARSGGGASSDLRAGSGGGASSVLLAGSAEFVESDAALPAFQKAYGFTLRGDQLLVLAGGDTSATIKAAAEGISGVNASMVYSTDGAIAVTGLVVLEDPKHVEMVYQPAPVVRDAVLKRYPAMRGALEAAFAPLTVERLRALNARTQINGEDASKVAADYLRTEGLVR
ncbi:glycine betaine ABC transporter substrate-binding protein [Luteibacter aegosomaticola]|uniref:glycine betaine ABC transporter substrate-binding protein n=1 Tax=Luteibacter aegosomaticola TaxID=2911538 RepID=UPI0024B4CA6F|nr:glycine betaine ABC transporter substrate-binding protein [Luteibacter aegosomaticola]